MSSNLAYRQRKERRKALKKLGCTIERYDQMFEKQNGKCAICNRPPTACRRLAVDHSHTSGKIRGLLCFRCNVGMGHFSDDPVMLQSAIEYLHNTESSTYD